MAINNIFVEEILTTMNKIEEKLEGKSFDDFKSNYHLEEDIIRYLNIIGEAARHISDDTKNEYPDIEWDELLNFRNILEKPDHISLVWDIATGKLKEIKPKLENVV